MEYIALLNIKPYTDVRQGSILWIDSERYFFAHFRGIHNDLYSCGMKWRDQKAATALSSLTKPVCPEVYKEVKRPLSESPQKSLADAATVSNTKKAVGTWAGFCWTSDQ